MEQMLQEVFKHQEEVNNIKQNITRRVVVTCRGYRGTIQVSKKDANTKETVTSADTVFVLYEYSNGRWTTPTNIASASEFDGTLVDGSGITVYRLKRAAGVAGTYKTGTLYYNASNGGRFRVVEYSAPYGYNVNTSWAQEIAISYDNQNITGSVENAPWKGNITAIKQDSTTGETVTSADTTFALYEWSVTQNRWVKPTHITIAEYDGLVGDNTGYKLKRAAGTAGTYKTGTLYYNASNGGRFRVVEYSAPYGYNINSSWSQEITINADNRVASGTVQNTPWNGRIEVTKQDSRTGQTVTASETVFVLYEYSNGRWTTPTHIASAGEFNGTLVDGSGVTVYRLKQKSAGVYQTGTLYYNASNSGKFMVKE